MKQNHYRAQIKRPLTAYVALLGFNRVKYCTVSKDAPKGLKMPFLSFSEQAGSLGWNTLFGVLACLFLFAMASLCYWIVFLFSI